jgi:hypothetical protein
MKSPIWTAIYHDGWGCRHEEFGHPKGQPISLETAKVLAQKYQKPREKLSVLVPSNYQDRYKIKIIRQWIYPPTWTTRKDNK